MSAAFEIVELDACDSTQDEVRAWLANAPPRSRVAIATGQQRSGRGRGGRSWHDPPGAALLLSVGRSGPLDARVLESLPARAADAILQAAAEQLPDVREHVVWKAPNDLVTARDGAKVAGVLVDARSTSGRVDLVVIGVGANLDARPFRTQDGREASSFAAACGAPLGHAAFQQRVSELLAALL